LAGLHDVIEQRLATARKAFGHPGTKGDASEGVWLELLQTYLPVRYQAAKAHVVDSNGKFSDQIDIVVFDRQYSPFIFQFDGQVIVPAESVYAAFEAKQTINASEIAYAQEKISTVRTLYRTSLPIPFAGGTYPPRALPHILGGILAFESEWTPPLGSSLTAALDNCPAEARLDIGCVAAHGIFVCDEDNCYTVPPHGKPATAFLFELIARLQKNATVPMIDVRAYSQWLLR
jgi:hypothetical protein